MAIDDCSPTDGLSKEELQLAVQQARQLLLQSSKSKSTTLPCIAALQAILGDVLDEFIVDVVQRTHREVWTCSNSTTHSHTDEGTSHPHGFKCTHNESEKCDASCSQPGAGAVEGSPLQSSKGHPDLWGQHSHPAKAIDIVECRNCGRQVQAGSFAPHLEKCMGKGRVAARSRRV